MAPDQRIRLVTLEQQAKDKILLKCSIGLQTCEADSKEADLV